MCTEAFASAGAKRQRTNRESSVTGAGALAVDTKGALEPSGDYKVIRRSVTKIRGHQSAYCERAAVDACALKDQIVKEAR
jgi:hypothetical protein